MYGKWSHEINPILQILAIMTSATDLNHLNYTNMKKEEIVFSKKFSINDLKSLQNYKL